MGHGPSLEGLARSEDPLEHSRDDEQGLQLPEESRTLLKKKLQLCLVQSGRILIPRLAEVEVLRPFLGWNHTD